MLTKKDHEKLLDEALRSLEALKCSGAVKIIPIALIGEVKDRSFILSFLFEEGQSVKQFICDLLQNRIKELKEAIDRINNKPQPKVFREHRGGLAESLETTIECPNGLSDIEAHYDNSILQHYIKDMYIQENASPDDRLPYVWGGKSYNVIARSVEDGIEFVIGQCNFYE